MKRPLAFAKMSGAGNDFVLITEAEARRSGRSAAVLARRLCDRRRGIGADGLLIVRRRDRRLDYVNADGSPAFCGNGSRCAAWWMFQQGWTRGSKAFSFETSEGTLQARVQGRERVRIRLPLPANVALGRRVDALGRAWRGHFLRVGVPHFVVPVSNLGVLDVVQAGRALRRHAAFAPDGTNVDFVTFEAGGLRMRTYERGVEDETLACGSGAAASGLAAALVGRARSPVRVRTRGGDVLVVTFKRGKGSEPSFQNLELEGPARIVFTGDCHV